MSAWAKKLVGTTLIASLIVGCGGGGGGGSGGGIAFVPPPAAGGPGAGSGQGTAAESKVVLTVELGGSQATAGTDGAYSVAPGKQVLINASEPVDWSGTSASDIVKRTEVSTTATRWISRLSNTDTTKAVTYAVTARTADGLSKTLRIVVRPGDSRNGDYKVFALNGSRQFLSIDFDMAKYEMTDLAGVKSGGMLLIPENPTNAYGVFNDRITTQVNVSSMAGFGDTVVGAFPFEVPFSSPPTFKAYPFVASRAFVGTQADIDGVYNHLRVDANASSRNSVINQIKLSGGGTVLTECLDNMIYRIELCPSGSTLVRPVARDAETDATGLWAILDPVTGARVGRFSIASVAGDKVFLAAGTLTPNSVPTATLSIGFPETADWRPFSGGGWSTNGTVDIADATATTSFLASSASTGATSLTSFTLGTLGLNGPLSMRSATEGSNPYFTMRSNKLEVLVGARNNATTKGFMHVGVINN